MTGPEPRLSGEERAYVVRLLHDSGKQFLDLIKGLNETQWTAQHAPGRWSVQQTAEHIVVGEKVMLAKVREAMAAPPNPDWQEQDARKTRFLDRVLPDRSQKAIAPVLLEPCRQWTVAETIACFKEGRALTLKFVEEFDQPLKDHAAQHPFPVFGLLNAYHWLLYIPLHNIRHNQQIAEALGISLGKAAGQ